jgi:hypothetical protein
MRIRFVGRVCFPFFQPCGCKMGCLSRLLVALPRAEWFARLRLIFMFSAFLGTSRGSPLHPHPSLKGCLWRPRCVLLTVHPTSTQTRSFLRLAMLFPPYHRTSSHEGHTSVQPSTRRSLPDAAIFVLVPSVRSPWFPPSSSPLRASLAWPPTSNPGGTLVAEE